MLAVEDTSVLYHVSTSKYHQAVSILVYVDDICWCLVSSKFKIYKDSHLQDHLRTKGWWGVSTDKETCLMTRVQRMHMLEGNN